MSKFDSPAHHLVLRATTLILSQIRKSNSLVLIHRWISTSIALCLHWSLHLISDLGYRGCFWYKWTNSLRRGFGISLPIPFPFFSCHISVTYTSISWYCSFCSHTANLYYTWSILGHISQIFGYSSNQTIPISSFPKLLLTLSDHSVHTFKIPAANFSDSPS